MDGHFRVQQKDIVLKRLSFSINGHDIEASGHCLKENIRQCDADIASKDLNMHFHTQNSSEGMIFNGWVDSDNVLVDFDRLTTRIVNSNFIKLRVQKIQSVFSVYGHEYTAPLDNVWASIDFAKPYRKIITLSAKIYTGILDSRIFLDTDSWPWHITGQGKFERIDMDHHGLLSGKFQFQASKDIEIDGDLGLHNGNFNNADFQKWMAKTLQMPSLNHVYDAELYGHFKIDGQSRMLDDLRLNTQNFDLNGFFHLNADNLVSSRGSVRFSKKLLSESPVGRHIIGLVHEAWTFPFEFSLSGDIHRMNFQWNNSPLKDKVRQHIFSFIERIIDRRMDAHPAYKVTIPNESVSPG